MTYLKFDLKKIKKLSKQKKKMIVNQSFQYSLISRKLFLMYQKKNDRRSFCLTKDQIESILEYLHDEHDHYNHVIILNRMKNKTY